ncbi:MAG: LiaF domain-containing protein [Anaerolineales bacterium]
MYRRGGLMWGSLLLALACLLLLQKLGWIEGDVWGYFWGLALMAAGIWLISAYFNRNRPITGEQVSIPLEGASRARVSIDHGAGKLNIRAGAPPDLLLAGTFSHGLDFRSHREADQLSLKMHNPPGFWTWSPGISLDWDVQFNPNIPLQLEVNSGASASNLDLTDLQITDLDLETGASSSEVTLPAHAGQTRVKIESGVSAVKICVPQGVALRIHAQAGLSSIHIDENRFPPQGGHIYQSPDYATAANRIDLDIEAGIGAVEIL